MVVIGSDGIYEFMSNEDIADIVMEFYYEGKAEMAANTVVNVATALWEKNESIIDDITCVVIFMDPSLIIRNTGKNASPHERPNFCGPPKTMKQPMAESMLEDILTEGNIIMEEEDE